MKMKMKMKRCYRFDQPGRALSLCPPLVLETEIVQTRDRYELISRSERSASAGGGASGRGRSDRDSRRYSSSVLLQFRFRILSIKKSPLFSFCVDRVFHIIYFVFGLFGRLVIACGGRSSESSTRGRSGMIGLQRLRCRRWIEAFTGG